MRHASLNAAREPQRAARGAGRRGGRWAAAPRRERGKPARCPDSLITGRPGAPSWTSRRPSRVRCLPGNRPRLPGMPVHGTGRVRNGRLVGSHLTRPKSLHFSDHLLSGVSSTLRPGFGGRPEIYSGRADCWLKGRGPMGSGLRLTALVGPKCPGPRRMGINPVAEALAGGTPMGGPGA